MFLKMFLVAALCLSLLLFRRKIFDFFADFFRNNKPNPTRNEPPHSSDRDDRRSTRDDIKPARPKQHRTIYIEDDFNPESDKYFYGNNFIALSHQYMIDPVLKIILPFPRFDFDRSESPVMICYSPSVRSDNLFRPMEQDEIDKYLKLELELPEGRLAPNHFEDQIEISSIVLHQDYAQGHLTASLTSDSRDCFDLFYDFSHSNVPQLSKFPRELLDYILGSLPIFYSSPRKNEHGGRFTGITLRVREEVARMLPSLKGKHVEIDDEGWVIYARKSFS